jgi:hypothetical protein
LILSLRRLETPSPAEPAWCCFQEAALVLGVRKSIEENLPAPGSGNGFKP